MCLRLPPSKIHNITCDQHHYCTDQLQYCQSREAKQYICIKEFQPLTYGRPTPSVHWNCLVKPGQISELQSYATKSQCHFRYQNFVSALNWYLSEIWAIYIWPLGAGSRWWALISQTASEWATHLSPVVRVGFIRQLQCTDGVGGP